LTASLILQQVLNGLLDGVYYLLIALGLSLIFSLGGIVNLAHGAFFAMGAYLTIVLTPHIGYVTIEALETQFVDIFDQINAYASGSPINVVNPEVLGSAQLRR